MIELLLWKGWTGMLSAARSGVLLLLVAAGLGSLAHSAQIPVDFVDNDGPRWSGIIDTTTDKLTIHSFVNYPSGPQFVIPPFPYVMSAASARTTIVGWRYWEPYDVPDDWQGSFRTFDDVAAWAFLEYWTNSGTYHAVSGPGFYRGIANWPVVGTVVLGHSSPDMLWIGGLGPRGDIDYNGVLRVPDLDQLSLAIRLGEQHVAYDLNQDGLVSAADRLHWILNLAHSTLGDSDLNYRFNSDDFILAFQGGKYETLEPAGWADGDWDGNALFNSADMVAAFQLGAYEQQPAAATVPEPSAIILALLGMLCLLRHNRWWAP